jgi:hypothetical protein
MLWPTARLVPHPAGRPDRAGLAERITDMTGAHLRVQ